jgi:hypothetical protein
VMGPVEALYVRLPTEETLTLRTLVQMSLTEKAASIFRPSLTS